jgi:predicted porin
MKKTLIALAALGVVSTAMADVTVYGRVDAGVTFSNGSTSVASGVTGTPRLGFKGSEDLGGGLSANFGIETGFNNIAEAATSIGDRGAFIGVAGGFGSVKIGSSLLTPSFFVSAATDATGLPNYLPAESRRWGQGHQNLRHDNAIQYDNSIGGVAVKVSYVPAANNTNQARTDLAAIYNANGLTLALASHSDADRSTIMGVGYDFGTARVTYSRSSGTTATTGSGMGISMPMGAVTLGAAVYKDDDSSATVAHAAYSLSKSTGLNVYVQAPKGSDSTIGVGLSHSF